MYYAEQYSYDDNLNDMTNIYIYWVDERMQDLNDAWFCIEDSLNNYGFGGYITFDNFVNFCYHYCCVSDQPKPSVYLK